MLERVIERCKLNKMKCKVIVCTDNPILTEIAQGCGVDVFQTSEKCSSGTERIASIIWEILEFLWEENLSSKSGFEKDRF